MLPKQNRLKDLISVLSLSKGAGDGRRQYKYTRHSGKTFVLGGEPLRLAHFAAEVEFVFDSDDISPLCKHDNMQLSST